MTKNIIAVFIMALLVTACGTTGRDNKDNQQDNALAEIAFSELIASPEAYLDKDITIEGKVIHVCKHSGKRMFIVGDNPDIRLLITVNDELPKFPMELLGSYVSVSGHLTKSAPGEQLGKGMGEGENHDGEGKDATENGEACETEAAVAEQPVLSDYVLHYTSHKEK